MIKEKLDFKKFESSGIICVCKWCGKQAYGSDWLIAELRPFENQLNDVSIVVCSDACKESFLQYEHCDKALMVGIVDIAHFEDETLNEEYKNYYSTLL